mmetsp:Transcript_61917/g.119355  ORF Transcript_61917/g.119355 Transcript_61917/m.119355 type:complete len:210 (-) Transcript_61917:261-890(-)
MATGATHTCEAADASAPHAVDLNVVESNNFFSCCNSACSLLLSSRKPNISCLAEFTNSFIAMSSREAAHVVFGMFPSPNSGFACASSCCCCCSGALVWSFVNSGCKSCKVLLPLGVSEHLSDDLTPIDIVSGLCNASWASVACLLDLRPLLLLSSLSSIPSSRPFRYFRKPIMSFTVAIFDPRIESTKSINSSYCSCFSSPVPSESSKI